MKHITEIIGLLTIFITMFYTNNAQAAIKKTATFKSITFEHNVTKDGQKGMYIAVTFSVTGMKYKTGKLNIYFCSNDGKPLKDKNKKQVPLYSTPSGNIALGAQFTPRYDNTTVTCKPFIPYRELHLGKGTYELKYYCNILDNEANLMAKSNKQTLLYKKDANNAATSYTRQSKPATTATFKSITLEHNATKNGQKGMNVVITFSVNGMKGKTGGLNAYFLSKDGKPLKDKNKKQVFHYSTPEGDIAVGAEFTPRYDNSIYTDYKLFIPYDELHLGKGTYELKYYCAIFDYEVNQIATSSKQTLFYEKDANNSATSYTRQSKPTTNQSLENILNQATRLEDEGNYTEAIKLYRKLAEQGIPEGQYNLGTYYFWGKAVKQDYTQAVKWYRKAAEQGLDEAQYNLGSCYEFGYGIQQDYAQAVKWYHKAAEQGHAKAQAALGDCCRKGTGVPKNIVQAFNLYQKAAEQGDAYAQNNLGGCYYSGDGVKQDYTQAFKWYRKAAEQGFIEAQCNLGVFYELGQGVQKDYIQAVKWYRKAAEQGYAAAQYALGNCYHFGTGIQQDYTQSIKWFKKAAEQGFAAAQYNLGTCYYSGYGTQQDYAQAFRWFKKAAEQGYADAQYNLGICYEEGIGVAKNQAEANKWYQKAAEQGYTGD